MTGASLVLPNARNSHCAHPFIDETYQALSIVSSREMSFCIVLVVGREASHECPIVRSQPLVQVDSLFLNESSVMPSQFFYYMLNYLHVFGVTFSFSETLEMRILLGKFLDARGGGVLTER